MLHAQVVVSNESGLTQDITAGRHRLRADEPLPFGDDAGPSPYDLLLAALGACTSMTLRLYAIRKQWDLKRVTVRVGHSRIHAEDCQECETKSGFLNRIELELELQGDLDAGQRERLRDIAEKCPLHRTLQSEMSIRTTLAAADL